MLPHGLFYLFRFQRRIPGREPGVTMHLDNHRAAPCRADVLGQCRMVNNERTRLGIEKHRIGNEVVKVGRQHNAERRIILSTELRNHRISKAWRCSLADLFDLGLSNLVIGEAVLNYRPIRCRRIIAVKALNISLSPFHGIFTRRNLIWYPALENKLPRRRYPGRF